MTLKFSLLFFHRSLDTIFHFMSSFTINFIIVILNKKEPWKTLYIFQDLNCYWNIPFHAYLNVLCFTACFFLLILTINKIPMKSTSIIFCSKNKASAHSVLMSFLIPFPKEQQNKCNSCGDPVQLIQKIMTECEILNPHIPDATLFNSEKPKVC